MLSFGVKRPSSRTMAMAATLAAALALAACGKDDGAAGAAAAGAGAGGQQAPRIPVGVVTAAPANVGIVTELPGRVEASRTAQVRARAAGILQKRLFREGSDVKAGQPLFEIDAAPYQAALQSAQATLAQAQAQADQASTQLERYRPLAAAKAVSQQDFDNATAAHKQAQAAVLAAQAAVRTAQINLSYARVTAPISGRIGRALVTEGALVGQGDATQLATIQQINPVYVNFTQSAADAFKLRQAAAAGRVQAVGGDVPVQVVLEDGTLYEHAGKLLFTDLSVDASTGQVTLRAEIPNPTGELLPGLYVRVQLEQAQATDAIAVPQQAVTRSAAGDTLTVVKDDGTREVRPVQVTAGHNNQWIVQSGLKAGEQVMVDGFQKLQFMPPQTLVVPVPWKAEAAAEKPADAASATDNGATGHSGESNAQASDHGSTSAKTAQ